MDIYGINKSIQVIEQVFLEMTMVLVDPCIQEYSSDGTSVSRDD